MWEPQLQSFPESHQVVRVDLPGFGESPFDGNVVSYRGAIREALEETPALSGRRSPTRISRASSAPTSSTGSS
jgi:hypothetical protein